ncbi:hypothetical protein KC19_7G156300 [Ceratodon purpureus]|uniref:Uncharacterized protein n=1 Tax=Ceratodon purpureus TaxID=3225 RepID=A0A8T0HAM0_CERPU|nr:hypothetical protein KC19_7G156300 [Ceratodon purpureus]
MGDKTFADKELAGEMGSFKEPGVRLKQVEGEGASSFADGDLEKALFLGMQQLALAKLCYEEPNTKDKEVMMAQAHYNLSVIYYEMGLGDQSLYHAQKALERVDPRKTGEGENNNFTVSCMMAIARAMIQRSDPKCVNFLQRALVVNHELNGPDHDSNFRIHEGFGDFYVLLGDSRALYKATTAKKDTSVDVNAKKKQEPDDYEKAMDEYATAYSKIAGGGKATAFYGGLGSTKDARMGDMFGHAAKTRSKMGNDNEAAVIYEKAVACLESASKPNKAKIAQMCYELGATYHKAKVS